MKQFPIAVAAACLVWGAGVAKGEPAPAQDGAAVEITEWSVPFRTDWLGRLHDEAPEGRRGGTRPRDPYVDSQGRVWFCGQAGNYIASLDPKTGRFRRFALEDGTHPHNLIIDSDDAVWYAGNANARIGKLDPSSGKATLFEMPDPNAVRDPHTLAMDRHGNIWFTAQQSNAVGKLTVATGAIEILPVPTPRARPYGIVMDTDRERPWIVLFGSHKLATVDPASMQLSEIELPRKSIRPRRLAITSDGAIWMVDYAEGFLVRFDRETGTTREWRAPGGAASRPYAMAVDDRDRLWFVESPDGRSRLVGFDPETDRFFSITELESGGLTARHMVFHRPSRELWFGTDANTIARAAVP